MIDSSISPSHFDAIPAPVWEAIRSRELGGRVVFVTGATGFVGGWVLAAIARLNAQLDAPVRVRALTRISRPTPVPWLTWVPGDVRDFRDDEHADLVLHAALPSTATAPEGGEELRDVALRGIETVMSHARRVGADRTLVLSSGAVYGCSTGPVSEAASFGPLDPHDTYSHVKREVESIAQAHRADSLEVVIARLFTCIGPGYRSHEHLAHVSLVNAARAGRPLALRGDGLAIRSYLYGADLALWLLTLLCGSGHDIVNVGSDEAMTLRGFAERVARAAGRGCEPIVTGSAADKWRPYFVPDIARARDHYELAPWTSLEQALARSLVEDRSIDSGLAEIGRI